MGNKRHFWDNVLDRRRGKEAVRAWNTFDPAHDRSSTTVVEPTATEHLERLLSSFLPDGANFTKTSDKNAVLGGIKLTPELPPTERQEAVLRLLAVPGQELRDAFPLYDLLLRLPAPEGAEPAKAQELREACIENIDKRKGDISITISDIERKILATRLQEKGSPVIS